MVCGPLCSLQKMGRALSPAEVVGFGGCFPDVVCANWEGMKGIGVIGTVISGCWL